VTGAAVRTGACARCLRRAWLLGRLAGHLDNARGRIDELLELADDPLIAALAGRHAAEVERDHGAFDAAVARERCAAAGVEAVCRCHDDYPPALHELSAPPAVLFVLGGVARLRTLLAAAPVALVGARRASPYGRAVARSLGRELGAAGVTVISGLALGVDSAAHRGALDAGAATVAVLAAAPERPYPASARALHRRIAETGAVVSELGPGIASRRWMFPARNRIMAALSAMTVVVQARTGSGSLVTARRAGELHRRVGAVPGDVGAPLSAGPHRLLRGGATLVTDGRDVLDAVFGAGVRTGVVTAQAPADPVHRALLEAIADGHPVDAAFALAGVDAGAGLAALAALELEGWLAHEPGGRYTVVR
jgi:DNA processing protein